MFPHGRNNLIAYCLQFDSKHEVRIRRQFSQTVIAASDIGVSDPCNTNPLSMAIADSQGDGISVNCHKLGEFALAVDGKLSDQDNIFRQILTTNMVMLNKSTEELIAHILAIEATKGTDFPSVIKDFLRKYPGGYSLIIMTKEQIYAVRDCHGVKPLVIGRLDDTHEVIEYDLETERPLVKNKTPNVIASNSVTLENIGAKYIRQVLPGEIVELSSRGIKSLGICYRQSGDMSTMCSMEYVMMEPSSSFLEEQRVYNVRYRLGQFSARGNSVESDCLITLPNISMAFVLGYEQVCRIGIIEAFYYSNCSNDDTTRTLCVYNENVADKVVTLVVDSSLNKELTVALHLLKNASVKKVHLRMCSPKVVAPCPFGINLTTDRGSLDNIASICFLPLESLSAVIRQKIPDWEVKNVGHCFHCLGKSASQL